MLSPPDPYGGDAHRPPGKGFTPWLPAVRFTSAKPSPDARQAHRQRRGAQASDSEVVGAASSREGGREAALVIIAPAGSVAGIAESRPRMVYPRAPVGAFRRVRETMETNQLTTEIQDLAERVAALRGYL